MEQRGHRQYEHTADLALEIWAESQEDLLLEAARAVLLILTEDQPIRATASRELEVDGLDAEDRLVQWLNRILLLALLDGFLFAGGEVRLTETALTATVHGQPDAFDLIRTELKSVTYHDLFLGREEGCWLARIVIDV